METARLSPIRLVSIDHLPQARVYRCRLWMLHMSLLFTLGAFLSIGRGHLMLAEYSPMKMKFSASSSEASSGYFYWGRLR